MAPERDAFLSLIKPPGMTSHDLVGWIRDRLGVRRVGHLGTLDPAAAGVLPIAVGRATRLFQFAAGPTKSYRAEVVFGVATDTLDAEGRVLARRDSSTLSRSRLQRLLERARGEVEQRPPAFSAARVGGRRLHELAREGRPQRGRPRRVTIEELRLVDFSPGRVATALIDVVCTPGTYVRSLVDDLGRTAGCGAHLGFLVRTAAGRFALSEAATIGELDAACRRNEVEDLLVSPDYPLAHFPEIEVDQAAACAFAHGTRVCAGDSPEWPVRVYGPEHSFLGLGEVLGRGVLRPRVVLVSARDVAACG